MYLLTILRAAEDGHEGPLGLASLAERLAVSPASANEMVRKMAGRGLVTYEPYKGASLTEAGSTVAMRVVRSRRLWSRFLADRLGFSPRQADAMACDLEHVTTVEAVERLADYLGHPESGPLGHPIPRAGSLLRESQSESLVSIPAGDTVEVVTVIGDNQAVSFLTASGVEAGERLTILATGAAGVLMRTRRGEVHLDATFAGTVRVRPAGGGHAG